MKKKVLALFLSAALCVTLLPATGMAAEFGSGDAEIVENAANSQEMFSAEETTEPRAYGRDRAACRRQYGRRNRRSYVNVRSGADSDTGSDTDSGS